MSHMHEGRLFEKVEEAFGAPIEPEAGEGVVVIHVPAQNPDSLVRGLRFIRTEWDSGVVPPPAANVVPVVHFEAKADSGVVDGTVPFDPPITLDVPYTRAIRDTVQNADELKSKLKLFDDVSREWKVFGVDPIFGHIQTVDILEDLQIARVSRIERWADPHIGWHI